jgi:8-oxo-dGTP diphosphatase
VIDHIHCAVCALIFKDDKFLILKRSIGARSHHFKWDLPGGAVEFKEHPVSAVIREVKEETSLDVDCLFPITTWTFMANDNCQVIGITFLCQARHFGGIILSKEHEDYAWIQKYEVGNYPFAGGLASEIESWDLDYILEINKRYK